VEALSAAAPQAGGGEAEAAVGGPGLLTAEHMGWLDAVTPPGREGYRWITGVGAGAMSHLYGW